MNYLPIKGYEDRYLISDHGGVWSMITERFLKCGLSVGYRFANLHDGKRSRSIKVHRLVAEAFIPKPNGTTEINHKNGNKLDNRLKNLEWCSRSENVAHAWATGAREVTARMRQSVKENGRKRRRLNPRQAAVIRGSSESSADLALRFSLSPRSIRDIRNGITYRE